MYYRHPAVVRQFLCRKESVLNSRTTVNNLCLNQIRATGSRPNLVAIDSETSQERISELSAEAHIPFDASLAAAEDASIIREALSRLSADQRTALVMWEMEGRTTEEIAASLGTTHSAESAKPATSAN